MGIRFAKLLVLSVTISTLFMSASAAAFNPFGTACNGSGNDVQSLSSVCSQSSSGNPISGTDGIILNVANIVAILGGAAAVVVLIIGGFRYVSSGGQSESVAKAKNTVLSAIIGLVIIASARLIVSYVVSKV